MPHDMLTFSGRNHCMCFCMCLLPICLTKGWDVILDFLNWMFYKKTQIFSESVKKLKTKNVIVIFRRYFEKSNRAVSFCLSLKVRKYWQSASEKAIAVCQIFSIRGAIFVCIFFFIKFNSRAIRTRGLPSRKAYDCIRYLLNCNFRLQCFLISFTQFLKGSWLKEDRNCCRLSIALGFK